MSLTIKLKRAFTKAHKLFIFFVFILSFVFVFCFSVSATSYSISHDTILTPDTWLSVTNGKDYFKYYKPSLCNNYDDYSICDWVIKDYNPPQDSAHSSLSTNIYLRLDQFNGIYVNKGQRLTITFEIAYDGTVDYDEYLTTRLKLQGWNTVSPRQYIGTLPKGSRTNVVFTWDNTIGECNIQYFDINFAIKNNKIINNDFFFEWFYGNLVVDVSPIPSDPLTDPNYSSVNSGVVNNHNKLENSIMEDTSVGRESAVGIIDSINDLADSNLFKGLLAWSKIITYNLENSPWFSQFLKFSLAIGLFAFLLGLGIYVANVHSSKVRRENAKASKSNRKGRGG